MIYNNQQFLRIIKVLISLQKDNRMQSCIGHCQICAEKYNSRQRKQMIICLNQHFVCLSCAKDISCKSSKCPFCKKKFSMDEIQPRRFFTQQTIPDDNHYQLQKLYKIFDQLDMFGGDILYDVKQSPTDAIIRAIELIDGDRNKCVTIFNQQGLYHIGLKWVFNANPADKRSRHQQCKTIFYGSNKFGGKII